VGPPHPPQGLDLLLYNVTSTYFEGLAARNPLAQRGHSRDHRPDCKQVCIALVVSREGMPLGYEVFPGNRTTTVEEIVDTMEARYGIADREPRDRRRARLADGARGVEAKLGRGPEGTETFLLCRSADRRKKEQAMHERFSKRIEARLESLGRRLERSRQRLDREAIGRQVGRILGQNSRAAGRYQIRVVDDPERASGLRLAWSAQPEWDEWALHSEGTYILRTNVAEWTPEELWRTYIQLTEAEAAFRIHKSDLSIRPIWYQKAERVQAHILVCFLAYVFWKTLEQWQQRAGLGHRPRTILEEIGRIQSTDVVLPLADEPGRELRLRCVVRPDQAQAMLLDRLGLRLPERLRIPPRIDEM